MTLRAHCTADHTATRGLQWLHFKLGRLSHRRRGGKVMPTSADDASTRNRDLSIFIRKTQSWLKVCVSNHDEGKHVMMNSLCARSNFCRKIETGLNYRANEAAINGVGGGESCPGGVLSSREEGREMNCNAHSRTRARTQVEVASDSTVRDDSFVQLWSSGAILNTYPLYELSTAYVAGYSTNQGKIILKSLLSC